MQYERYDINASPEGDSFEFISVGKKGIIEKIVLFQETDDPLVYNLAFGDKKYIQKNGIKSMWVDDTSTSENGDRNKVLSTVVEAVNKYTAKYTDRLLIFTGNDERKTRLYRMAISLNYDELSRNYHIFGLIKEDDELVSVPFDKNISFAAYLIKRKTVQL